MSEDAMMPGELRFYQAYLMMAKEANYRPAAPGDGMGNTYLTKTQAAGQEHTRLDLGSRRIADSS
jgi:hypothetical protein